MSTLGQDLSTLLSTGTFSDVKICVGSTTFPAHKAILAARSDVFRAMFEAPMVEAAENCVKICGFSEVVVKGMLEYIYSDSTKIEAEDAGSFLAIADFYNLESLKTKAARALLSILVLGNAVKFLRFSNLYNCQMLKIEVTNFIVRNRATFIASPQIQELTKEEVTELFVATVKYCEANCVNTDRVLDRFGRYAEPELWGDID